MIMSSDTCQGLPEAYAFLGNSLLKPMTHTAKVGLNAEFWRSFPDFECAEVGRAAGECALWAESMAGECHGEDEAARRVSVDYAHLFVGPPRPAAPPWETMVRHEGACVGFGEATFEMRALLRDAGLQLVRENSQYEDHMGIELLYLSEQCRRLARGEGGVSEGEISSFIEQHPLGWIEAFLEAVRRERSGSYYARILSLTAALLRWHAGQMQV